MTSILHKVDLFDAAYHSRRRYHAPGLDYLCLFRSEELTLKAYFFDEAIDGDVVVPHTHRYSFETRVLRGSLFQRTFRIADFGAPYVHLEYDPVTCGGEGFSVLGACTLQEETRGYTTGQRYFNQAHTDIHTLANVQAGTVLLLLQYPDTGSPKTSAFTQGPIPSTDGLYLHMSRSQVRRRLRELAEVLGESAGALP